MNLGIARRAAMLILSLLFLSTLVCAQGTLADYERAQGLRKQFEGLAVNLPGRVNWIAKTNRFWYRKSVKRGNEFVLVDAETLAKKPAFDHEKLAASLSAATGEKYNALDLPFVTATPPFTTLTFVDNERAIEFVVTENRWNRDLTNYNCTKLGTAERRGPGALPQLRGPQIGMLFWRMHRCARIIFSLSFHLGQMSPKECIDFLVQRVGHQPENATAEVRRSFNGSYAPLYQAAYLLGGLQIYSLHKELVDTGKMTNRAFHDAVLQENSIPIEMVRASLTKQKLPRDFTAHWKFYGRQ